MAAFGVTAEVWIARVFEQLRRSLSNYNVARVDLGGGADLVNWDLFELDWERVGPFLVGKGLPNEEILSIRALTPGGGLATDLLECDGIDAVQLLADATRLYRPRGIRSQRDVTTGELSGMLRVAFDLDELDSEEMYLRMKHWERRNHSYPLLLQWRTLDSLGVVLDQRYWEKDLVATLRFLGERGMLAVFKMDLDNFKTVNDILGHSAGDDAIRLYCAIVKKAFLKIGEVYRRGGDEVVAFAPGIDGTAARTLAEDIRRTVETDFRDWGVQRGLDKPPTASIGLVLTDGGRSVTEIVLQMDTAQHRAKQEGKNRVVCID